MNSGPWWHFLSSALYITAKHKSHNHPPTSSSLLPHSIILRFEVRCSKLRNLVMCLHGNTTEKGRNVSTIDWSILSSTRSTATSESRMLVGMMRSSGDAPIMATWGGATLTTLTRIWSKYVYMCRKYTYPYTGVNIMYTISHSQNISNSTFTTPQDARKKELSISALSLYYPVNKEVLRLWW